MRSCRGISISSPISRSDWPSLSRSSRRMPFQRPRRRRRSSSQPRRRQGRGRNPSRRSPMALRVDSDFASCSTRTHQSPAYLRCNFEFTLCSLRCHFGLISCSLQCHFDPTSISLRLYFDATRDSFWCHLRFHFDVTSSGR